MQFKAFLLRKELGRAEREDLVLFEIGELEKRIDGNFLAGSQDGVFLLYQKGRDSRIFQARYH